MLELLQYVLSGFWRFMGFLILFETVLTVTIVYSFKTWNRFMRHLNIRKHGWPPPYCDGDGDPVDYEEDYPNDLMAN